MVKVNLGRVDFLTNNTAAALDRSLEGTMPAVIYFNGLVLLIPGISFHYYFSTFPSMLTCQSWLSLFLQQHFPNIFDMGPLCLLKYHGSTHPCSSKYAASGL
jgi:hypothetical protein